MQVIVLLFNLNQLPKHIAHQYITNNSYAIFQQNKFCIKKIWIGKWLFKRGVKQQLIEPAGNPKISKCAKNNTAQDFLKF